MAIATLTRREQDVLGGLLEGKTNKMIARHLGLSPRTVEVYRAALMKKTGVSSVAALVRLAVGAGDRTSWRRAERVRHAVDGTAKSAFLGPAALSHAE